MSSCCSPGWRSQLPGGGGNGHDRDPRFRPAAGATACGRRRWTSTDTRAPGLPATDDGAGESRRTRSSSPPQLAAGRRSSGASDSGRRLARQGMERPARTTAWLSQSNPCSPAPRGRRRRPLRGAGPRLPLLPGVRAGAFAQHPQRLSHRPLPVRRIPRRAQTRRAHGRAPPTSPTSSPTWRPATGAPPVRRRPSTARPPACAPSTSTCAATS